MGFAAPAERMGLGTQRHEPTLNGMLVNVKWKETEQNWKLFFKSLLYITRSISSCEAAREHVTPYARVLHRLSYTITRTCVYLPDRAKK